MIPIKFDEAMDDMVKPENMTDEECSSLPFHLSESAGTPIVTSCWELSKEELEQIQKTGKIWLQVWQFPVPPFSVNIQSPFEAPKEKTVDESPVEPIDKEDM